MCFFCHVQGIPGDFGGTLSVYSPRVHGLTPNSQILVIYSLDIKVSESLSVSCQKITSGSHLSVESGRITDFT